MTGEAASTPAGFDAAEKATAACLGHVTRPCYAMSWALIQHARPPAYHARLHSPVHLERHIIDYLCNSRSVSEHYQHSEQCLKK